MNIHDFEKRVDFASGVMQDIDAKPLDNEGPLEAISLRGELNGRLISGRCGLDGFEELTTINADKFITEHGMPNAVILAGRTGIMAIVQPPTPKLPEGIDPHNLSFSDRQAYRPFEQRNKRLVGIAGPERFVTIPGDRIRSRDNNPNTTHIGRHGLAEAFGFIDDSIAGNHAIFTSDSARQRHSTLAPQGSESIWLVTRRDTTLSEKASIWFDIEGGRGEYVKHHWHDALLIPKPEK